MRSRFTMTRACYTKDAVLQTKDEALGIEVYYKTYSTGGINGIGFAGKRNKPDFNIMFKTMDRFIQYTNDYVKRISERAAAKKAQPKRVTEAAKTAAAVREELKKAFPGVTFKVTSSNFAGGDSVDVGYIDGPTEKQVNDICDKYEYGSFNGMEDIYEYTNSRDDIPQVKYLHVTRGFSNEVLKDAVASHNSKWSGDYKIEIIDKENNGYKWQELQYIGNVWHETCARSAVLGLLRDLDLSNGKALIIDQAA